MAELYRGGFVLRNRGRAACALPWVRFAHSYHGFPTRAGRAGTDGGLWRTSMRLRHGLKTRDTVVPRARDINTPPISGRAARMVHRRRDIRRGPIRKGWQLNRPISQTFAR